MDGTTAMGPVMNGAHVVDNVFEAYMLLLTQQRGRHRWTVRLDDFSVVDRDTTPLDDNAEDGYATTLAYRLTRDAAWSFGVEWVELDVTRPANVYFGEPAAFEDSIVRVGARYRLQPSIFER
jgi:hypothetical protein